MRKLIRLMALTLTAATMLMAQQVQQRVHVLYVPLGIWTLCAVGVALPGCGAYAEMPHQWLEIVYLWKADGQMRIIKQLVVEAPGRDT